MFFSMAITRNLICPFPVGSDPNMSIPHYAKGLGPAIGTNSSAGILGTLVNL